MTGLTYRNRQEEQDDRAQQERLVDALDVSPSQLGRDDCGWWVVRGRQGSIQTWGDGKRWVAYVICRSKQHWTFTKKRLSFMSVTQDGDDEGVFACLIFPLQSRLQRSAMCCACESGSNTRPKLWNGNERR